MSEEQSLLFSPEQLALSDPTGVVKAKFGMLGPLDSIFVYLDTPIEGHIEAFVAQHKTRNYQAFLNWFSEFSPEQRVEGAKVRVSELRMPGSKDGLLVVRELHPI